MAETRSRAAARDRTPIHALRRKLWGRPAGQHDAPTRVTVFIDSDVTSVAMQMKEAFDPDNIRSAAVIDEPHRW